MIRSVRFLLVSVLAGAVYAAPAQAQAAASNGAPVSVESRGPTVSNARVAVSAPGRLEAELPGEGPPLPPVVQPSKRYATTLMIVGGAMLLAGAVIGDDAGTIIMIGGAAVGIYGLYWFLN